MHLNLRSFSEVRLHWVWNTVHLVKTLPLGNVHPSPCFSVWVLLSPSVPPSLGWPNWGGVHDTRTGVHQGMQGCLEKHHRQYLLLHVSALTSAYVHYSLSNPSSFNTPLKPFPPCNSTHVCMLCPHCHTHCPSAISRDTNRKTPEYDSASEWCRWLGIDTYGVWIPHSAAVVAISQILKDLNKSDVKAGARISSLENG